MMHLFSTAQAKKTLRSTWDCRMIFRRTTAEECELHFTRVAPAGMDLFFFRHTWNHILDDRTGWRCSPPSGSEPDSDLCYTWSRGCTDTEYPSPQRHHSRQNSDTLPASPVHRQPASPLRIAPPPDRLPE